MQQGSTVARRLNGCDTTERAGAAVHAPSDAWTTNEQEMRNGQDDAEGVCQAIAWTLGRLNLVDERVSRHLGLRRTLGTGVPNDMTPLAGDRPRRSLARHDW